MSTTVSGQQVWVAKPGSRYHNHAVLYPGLDAPVPFMVHRHQGGAVAHGHWAVQTDARGTHALDAGDVTPAEDFMEQRAKRYPREEFARDMRAMRRRQAEMEAIL